MFLVCTDSWDLQAFRGTVPGRLLFVIKRIFFQEKCSFFPSSDSCNLTLYLDSVRMFKCCFCVCILYNPKPFISDDADWSLTLLSSFFLFFLITTWKYVHLIPPFLGVFLSILISFLTTKTCLPYCIVIKKCYCHCLPTSYSPQIALVLLPSLLLCPNWDLMIMEHHDRG